MCICQLFFCYAVPCLIFSWLLLLLIQILAASILSSALGRVFSWSFNDYFLPKLITSVDMWQMKFHEDDSSNFQDRLLPFIIGLLRTVSTSFYGYFLMKLVLCKSTSRKIKKSRERNFMLAIVWWFGKSAAVFMKYE